MAREAEGEATKMHLIDAGANLDMVAAHFTARGLSKSGVAYTASVVGEIAESEKRAFAARASARPQPEILKGGLAEVILAPDEIKELRKAVGNEAVGLALSPLRLKTPLYAMAAFEADMFRQCGVAPSDLSARIASAGGGAVAEFIGALIERTGKTAAAFARDYMSDEDDEESKDPDGSSIKKIHRWRNGENVPNWRDILALGGKLGEDGKAGGDPQFVQARVMFLFMLAHYSAVATKCAERLKMRLDVGSEYRRFLDMHIAETKKRGRAD